MIWLVGGLLTSGVAIPDVIDKREETQCVDKVNGWL